MTKESKIAIVIRLLQQNKVKEDLCSPNFVADFATKRNINLTGMDVVYISNTYSL